MEVDLDLEVDSPSLQVSPGEELQALTEKSGTWAVSSTTCVDEERYHETAEVSGRAEPDKRPHPCRRNEARA